MSSSSLIPKRAAIAVDDLVDNCAHVRPGQQVLILALNEGLYGGINVVDEQTVAWIQAAVQQRGAEAYVLWADVPVRPTVLWGGGADPSKGWKVPKVIRAAMSEADVIISHAVDLTYEEELAEVSEILEEAQVPYVRNMATTAPLLASNWGMTPYELVSELRIQAAALIKPGSRWVITDVNGSHLEGTVDKPAGSDDYARYRTVGLYRPFPEGVFPSISVSDAEGVAVINEIGVIWARHIGLPSPFLKPVTVTVERGHIKKFEGGKEAETLTQFYKFMSKYLGDDAYEVRGFHGGVHPSARIEPWQCPNEPYRDFIEHHHWSSFHFHMGNSRRVKGFPYLMHVSGELREGSLKVGDSYIYESGQLTSINHPSVRAVAERFQDRPGLAPERWYQVPR